MRNGALIHLYPLFFLNPSPLVHRDFLQNGSFIYLIAQQQIAFEIRITSRNKNGSCYSIGDISLVCIYQVFTCICMCVYLQKEPH